MTARGVATLMLLAAIAILVYVVLDDSDEPADERPAPTFETDTDTEAITEPIAEVEATTQPVTDADAVTAALGREALTALGTSAEEVCGVVANWTGPATNAMVFLEPDASQASIDAIGEAAAALDRDAIYLSQQDAYVEFTEELFADNQAIVELVTPDILPASYRLRVPEDELESIAATFEAMPDVRKVITSRPAFGDDVAAACRG